ncbi:MAG: hypothetical protein KC964_04005 [Candidatus Omnitrophica bacterium]|nr:hypothetical protein [Candidatus Omnitrophota bacterium]
MSKAPVKVKSDLQVGDEVILVERNGWSLKRSLRKVVRVTKTRITIESYPRQFRVYGSGAFGESNPYRGAIIRAHFSTEEGEMVRREEKEREKQ